ncbi:MAG: PLP-dependent aminotransferase family protein [Pseudomonadota bacterium]
MNLHLDRNLNTPLVRQIEEAIIGKIISGKLKPNSRLSSIRQLSLVNKISRFTVVQAYDRLVAEGYLSSITGSGFYVKERKNKAANTINSNQGINISGAMDELWLIKTLLSNPINNHSPGSGWLPNSWLDEHGIQKALRVFSRKPMSQLGTYGHPLGFPPLREVLQSRLDNIEIQAHTQQILLTCGATHALNLVIQAYVRPGDKVLVDNPGYFILFGALKAAGAEIIGITRLADGPDLVQLESLLQKHQPKCYFIQSTLHNPTATSITTPKAYRLLQLAEKHQIKIIEDDINGDFLAEKLIRLSSLDQLKQTIFISSFSKSLSSSIRVGYIAANEETIQRLTDIKLLSGMTTPELNERLIHSMLIEGSYRKYLSTLQNKLRRVTIEAINHFESIQLTPFAAPEGGMFIWIRFPEQINLISMATHFKKQNITLAPGQIFTPHQEKSHYMRFNVASFNSKLLNEIAEYLLIH